MSARVRREIREGLVPLAVLGDRVLRWITPGDLRWLTERNTRSAHWARSDYRRSIDDIEWEAATFHNEIPFSGDVRSFILHSVTPSVDTTP